MTGNRITEKDRAARKEVAHLSVSVINGGILLTLNRAKNRVNSFRYCLGGIDKAAASGANDGYLSYLFDQLNKRKL